MYKENIHNNSNYPSSISMDFEISSGYLNYPSLYDSTESCFKDYNKVNCENSIDVKHDYVAPVFPF
jgi:hypothetical protein